MRRCRYADDASLRVTRCDMIMMMARSAYIDALTDGEIMMRQAMMPCAHVVTCRDSDGAGCYAAHTLMRALRHDAGVVARAIAARDITPEARYYICARRVDAEA